MTGHPGHVLRMSYLAAAVAGVAFFVMSAAWLGVWPARTLAEQARLTRPEHVLALTDSEARGRAIYAREGCAYCHSQQIRFADADVSRFGAPTLAWETRGDTPHLMGTRRIGPDLSRAGGTRSEDWHFAHLYAPRSVVPASVMPAYRSLFDGGPMAPKQGARDLVAYLETLGRARELAASPEGEGGGMAGDQMAGMARAAVLNAHPARARRTGDVPAFLPNGDAVLGAALFNDHCAACHGPSGAGDGPGAAGLRPRPTNLGVRSYRAERIAEVLWNGVAGTSMPAWRDRSTQELSAIAAYVRQVTVPGDPPSALREDRVAPTPQELELGRRVYAENCAQCHGIDGAGDGWAGKLLPIVPTNFRRQTMMFDEALRVLRNGIDGTPMAPWTARLRDDELMAVAHYVREFYR